MVLGGLGYFAAADPTAMAAEAQASCLQALEQADAIATAARAWILGGWRPRFRARGCWPATSPPSVPPW
jgi:hypothetical protein